MARLPKTAKIRRIGFSWRERLLVALGMTVLAGLLWGGGGLFLSGLVQKFEKGWQDRLRNQLKPTPERQDFVFLGIDEPDGNLSALEPGEVERSAALQMMAEPYPWNRAFWAETINRLGEAGARMILLDIYFPGPSGDQEADRALAEALERYRDRVVLASEWTPVSERLMQHFAPYEEFLGGGSGEYGYVSFKPDDQDDIFRFAQYRQTTNEASGVARHEDESYQESFAAVAARKLGVTEIPNEGQLRFAGWAQGGIYRAGQAYPPQSMYTLFGEREWEVNYKNGAFFKDKVVLVGPANPIFNDQLKTPSGIIFGAQMHLQALACLLEDSFWYEAPRWLSWLGLFGMAGVAAWLVMKVRSPLVVLGVSVGIAVVWVFGCAYAANASGVLFTGISGLLGLGFVTVGCEGAEFFFEQKARKKLHRQLSRSVSPDVAEAMVRAPEGYLDAARGGRRTVAVLFSDVRNFTARSEQMEPEALVLQLNAYFSAMVGAVFATKGTIDKFIGDAVMASWGGLLDLSEEEMAESSLAAAEGMLQALEGLNKGWRDVGWEKFEVGIGIHIGEAVVGEIGSRERSDFTAIGDAVNVASRIEGMTKHLGVPLLVSGRVAKAVEAGLCLLGVFRVKGREEPLEVYTVIGEDLSPWEEALEALRGGGVGGMSALAQGGAFGGPARFYLKWLEQRGGVVPKGWDGVVTLESK